LLHAPASRFGGGVFRVHIEGSLHDLGVLGIDGQRLDMWKLRTEEITRKNEAEERAYEQRLQSNPLVALHREMLEEHERKVSAARASFDARKADWATKRARFEQAKDDDLAMLAALADAARGHVDSRAELVRLHLCE